MKRTLLIASLLMPLSLAPAFAEGVTITGTNGGSIAKTRDCAREPGAAECQTATTYTTPDGQTAGKTRVRTTGEGQSTTETTFTGKAGETTTRKRIITWGN